MSIQASDAVLSFISEYQHSKSSKYSDVYLPATLKIGFDGQEYVFEEAGIRMKGNTSRREFFSDGKIIDCVHFKVSLKATFDSFEYDDALLSSFKHDWSGDANGRKKRKDRNFLGLEKFDLKFVPRNQTCVIREIYAYESFRDCGLMAPYATLVNMTLAGESSSLPYTCELVEPIDKEFLKRRMSKDDASGDLYKCTYNGMGKADFTRSGAVDKSTGERISYGKIGVKDAWNGYRPSYDLKTNEDLGEGSDFSSMSGLITTLWECIYGDGTSNDLENKLDVQQFLSFSAASYLLGNFDDQRYDYNNFYLYFRPDDGKAMFLPYDWDWCLGLDAGHNLAELAPMDQWTLDGGQNSNIYLATLFGDTLPYAETDYLGYVNQYVDKILDESAFSKMAEQYGETSEVYVVTTYMNRKKNRVG